MPSCSLWPFTKLASTDAWLYNTLLSLMHVGTNKNSKRYSIFTMQKWWLDMRHEATFDSFILSATNHFNHFFILVVKSYSWYIYSCRNHMDYHISEVPSRTSILCGSFDFAELKSIGWADILSSWQPFMIMLRSLYFTMCSLSYMLYVFVVNLSLRHVWDVSSLFWIKLKHMFWLSDPQPPPPSLLFLLLSPSTRHRPVNRVSSSLLHSPLSPFDPIIDWLQEEDSTRPTRANFPALLWRASDKGPGRICGPYTRRMAIEGGYETRWLSCELSPGARLVSCR